MLTSIGRTTSNAQPRIFRRASFSSFLSTPPEIYQEAAHAEFDLMLSGHTHGGQICLPGHIPISLDSVLPRRLGAGAWKYHNMTGSNAGGGGGPLAPFTVCC